MVKRGVSDLCVQVTAPTHASAGTEREKKVAEASVILGALGRAIVTQGPARLAAASKSTAGHEFILYFQERTY